MKIRTDFVTNSSSSSFMVTLGVKLADGTSVNVTSFEDSGDFEAKGCTMIAKNADNQVIASGSCEPLEYCMANLDIYDPDEIPWEVWEGFDLGVANVNLSEISGAENVEELIRVLGRPLGLDGECEMDDSDADEDEYDEDDYDEDDYDEDDEFEDEDAAEIVGELQESFNEMVEAWNEVMSEHLTSVEDLEEVSVHMEFGGRGEFLAGPDEILQKVFGWEHSYKITEILDMDDEDEIKEALRKVACLEKTSDASLENLIRFWKDCDCAPGMCHVNQKLQKDGALEISIVWDEDALDF